MIRMKIRYLGMDTLDFSTVDFSLWFEMEKYKLIA